MKLYTALTSSEEAFWFLVKFKRKSKARTIFSFFSDMFYFRSRKPQQHFFKFQIFAKNTPVKPYKQDIYQVLMSSEE